MNQKVSVFVPTYNSSKFLSFCLESLLNQTHPLYEIIVCDDASTDGTQDIVRSFADRFPEQIKPIFHEANLGIPKTSTPALRQPLATLCHSLLVMIGGNTIKLKKNWRP